MFSKGADDKVKVAKKDVKGCSVALKIEAGNGLVQSAMQTAAVRVQARAQVPGFRAGKAPLDIVKKNFPSLIEEEAVQIAARTAIAKALEAEKIHPINYPTVKAVNFDVKKPLSLDFEVEIQPVFEVKNYTGITIARKKHEVSDAEVSAEIDVMREHNSRLEPETADIAVESKHFIVADFTALDEGGVKIDKMSSSGELVDMSHPHNIEGLSGALLGAKKGETRKFETEREGKKIAYQIDVRELKNKILPELNEDFAKGMNFKSIEELRARVKEMLTAESKRKAENDEMDQISAHLIKNNQFDVPPSIMEINLQNSAKNLEQRFFHGGNITDEMRKDMRERLRPSVERDLKVGYILNAIAAKEKLSASPADVKAELDKRLQSVQNNEDKRKLENYFKENEEQIADHLTEAKTMEFIKKNAKITEIK